jgi:hypothetical protein
MRPRRLLPHERLTAPPPESPDVEEPRPSSKPTPARPAPAHTAFDHEEYDHAAAIARGRREAAQRRAELARLQDPTRPLRLVNGRVENRHLRSKLKSFVGHLGLNQPTVEVAKEWLFVRGILWGEFLAYLEEFPRVEFVDGVLRKKTR